MQLDLSKQDPHRYLNVVLIFGQLTADAVIERSEKREGTASNPPRPNTRRPRATSNS